MGMQQKLAALLRATAAVAVLAATTAGAARAQARLESAVSDPQLQAFGTYVHNVCADLNVSFDPTTGDSTNPQQDLFNRCNGAIRVAGGESGTNAGAILSQYAGLQKQAQQSDAVVIDNRVDSAIASRLEAVSRTTRASQFASANRPILLASNNQEDAGMVGAPTIRDRGFDGYVTGGFASGEQDSTNRELGFDYEAYWFMAGVDYLASSNAIVGAAVSYSEAEADFDASSALALDNPGAMDTETWSLALYGLVRPTERLEVTGLLAYGQSDYATERAIAISDPNAPTGISRTASGSTEGDAYQASVTGYYELLQPGAASFGPILSVSYYDGTIDGYTETGAQGLDLVYGDQDVESLQISAGLTASRAISTGWGILSPHVRARYILETQDDVQNVTVRYAAANPATGSFIIASNPSDDSSVELAGGVSAVWSGGLSGFVEAQTIVGLDNVEHYGLSAGLRLEF